MQWKSENSSLIYSTSIDLRLLLEDLVSLCVCCCMKEGEWWLPASHTMQAAWPSRSWKLPEGQGSGAALPRGQKCPAGHGHAVARV